MSEISYVLIVPERIHIRYPSIEEATEAAKEHLLKDPKFLMVPIHEISGNIEKRGRLVFRVGGRFQTIELTMS
ncbi:MAG TPA: hypothetical protein DEO33_05945 [Rikenellaceae bacterium]|nr:hypothetical protein [Rikenellaceae bacterium]